jgi:hypothetical protein
MSQAAHDRPEDETQLGPADPRLRDRAIAELRRRQAQATTPELAAHYARLATRAERAAEVHASPASPWTAATAEEADQRWEAMLAESQRVRRGLEEGRTPEELGLRSAGKAVAQLLRRRTAG